MHSFVKFSSRLCCILLFFLASTANCQNTRQDHMAKLAFMIGDWEGVSTSFKNDSIAKQVSAMEQIQYQVDKHLITIDLQSESLQLHTVIYYDDKDATYYYNSFYKKGAGKYPAEFKDGMLVVWPSKTKRFVFRQTGKNGFQEYGETLVNGKWTRYFEDNFTKKQKN